MTKILVAVAALGICVSGAMACPYSKNTTASVDRAMTVASIADEKAPQQSAPAEE